MIQTILGNSSIWYYSRILLDIIIGSYRKRKSIIKKRVIKNGDSVLDVGCGTGEYYDVTDGEFYGVDLDKKYINFANKKFKHRRNNITFEYKDLNKLSPKDKKFDVGLLIDLTHHISDKELSTLLTKLNSLTTKCIVICDPVKQSDSNFSGRFLTSLDRGGHIRPKNDLVKIIKKNLIAKKYEIMDLDIGPVQTLCILAFKQRNRNDDN